MDHSSKFQLTNYDEELLLNRSYIPPPTTGFLEDVEDPLDRDATVPPLRTAWVCWLYCSLVVLVPAISIADDFLYDLAHWIKFDVTFRSLATLQVVVLVLTLLLEWQLHIVHLYRKQHGFLQFYKGVKPLLRVPLLMCTLTVTAALLLDLYPPKLKVFGWVVQGEDLLTMLQVVQAIVVLSVCVSYSAKVWAHNNTDRVPDALNYLQETTYYPPCIQIRVDESASTRRTIVEQQAEVIRLMQRQKENLHNQLLRLQAIVDRHTEAHDMEEEAARSNLNRLLGAKEREIVSLTGEKESLLKEITGTWQLLDERDAEIHRYQLMRQQQLEENARLRATLEEWSHRNAKLENRLIQTRARLDEANDQLSVAHQAMKAAAALRPLEDGAGPTAGHEGSASSSVDESTAAVGEGNAATLNPKP